MLFAQPSPRARRAFTLIELLTVVIIIGLLAGLITGAAVHVRGRARRAAHVLELKQLEMALHAYRDQFGEFPPDDLREANWSAIRRHLAKAFPRYTPGEPSGSPEPETEPWKRFKDDVKYALAGWGLDISDPHYEITPREALVFFLGGRLDGQFAGFSANPANPFDDSDSRIGPFFDFDAQRVCTDHRRYFATTEAGHDHNPNRAIRYYRAENSLYLSNEAFMDSRTGGWVNPQSFQILSPGLGSGEFNALNNPPADPPVFPVGTNYDERHLEMMANFTDGTMEDAMP